MSTILRLIRRASVPVVLVIACTISLTAQAPTSSALTGRWDVNRTAIKSAGSQAFWFSFKTPLFMVYTFTADGTWTLTSAAKNSISRHGGYAIKGKKILLKEADGSKFDEWKAELTDDGNGLSVQSDKLMMQMTKLPTTP